MLSPWKKSFDKPRQLIYKQRHHFADQGPYSQNYGFSSSRVQMWELDHKEGWVLKNWKFRTEMLEKTLESPSDSKDMKPVIPNRNIHWFWSWNSNTLATWYEEMTQWKRSWCWKRLGRARGEVGDRGWDGWMASLTQWTWVCANLGGWRRTGKLGMLQFMGMQSWPWLSNWKTTATAHHQLV